jgi:hypothetical protein
LPELIAIVPLVLLVYLALPKIQELFQQGDSRVRESGMLALGALSTGCVDEMAQYIPQLFPFLLQVRLLSIAVDCCRLPSIAVDCRRLLSIAVDCCQLLSIAVDCCRLLSIAVDCCRLLSIAVKSILFCMFVCLPPLRRMLAPRTN